MQRSRKGPFAVLELACCGVVLNVTALLSVVNGVVLRR
jgi:hypothetical protein